MGRNCTFKNQSELDIAFSTLFWSTVGVWRYGCFSSHVQQYFDDDVNDDGDVDDDNNDDDDAKAHW